MNRYIIYCSKEQTKKAISLGAPISTTAADLFNNTWMKVTAEQMIGWLEEQKGINEINIFKTTNNWTWDIFDQFLPANRRYASRKEATLAAIDAALDYLEKKGNKDESK